MAWSERDIADLTGAVAVITGGNGGLGLETTRELARNGAHVVMAARNQEKAAAAGESILGEVASASIEVSALDLASLSSVRSFASRVLGAHPSIDILVNNAGVMAIPRAETADGFEMQFGVNHLGHFVLTALLLPALIRSTGGRVVTVTSGARFVRGATIDPDDPHLRTGYDPWRAYGQSKLANLQLAVELDRRLRAVEAPVKALCADPGFSATDLQAYSARTAGGRSQRFYHNAVRLVGASPLRGTLPQLRAATDPGLEGGTLIGLRFVVYGSPVRIPVPSGHRHPDRLRTMWEVSEQETGIGFDVAEITRRTRGSA